MNRWTSRKVEVIPLFRLGIFILLPRSLPDVTIPCDIVVSPVSSRDTFRRLLAKGVAIVPLGKSRVVSADFDLFVILRRRKRRKHVELLASAAKEIYKVAH